MRDRLSGPHAILSPWRSQAVESLMPCAATHGSLRCQTSLQQAQHSLQRTPELPEHSIQCALQCLFMAMAVHDPEHLHSQNEVVLAQRRRKYRAFDDVFGFKLVQHVFHSVFPREKNGMRGCASSGTTWDFIFQPKPNIIFRARRSPRSTLPVFPKVFLCELGATMSSSLHPGIDVCCARKVSAAFTKFLIHLFFRSVVATGDEICLFAQLALWIALYSLVDCMLSQLDSHRCEFPPLVDISLENSRELPRLSRSRRSTYGILRLSHKSERRCRRSTKRADRQRSMNRAPPRLRLRSCGKWRVISQKTGDVTCFRKISLSRIATMMTERRSEMFDVFTHGEFELGGIRHYERKKEMLCRLSTSFSPEGCRLLLGDTFSYHFFHSVMLTFIIISWMTLYDSWVHVRLNFTCKRVRMNIIRCSFVKFGIMNRMIFLSSGRILWMTLPQSLTWANSACFQFIFTYRHVSDHRDPVFRKASNFWHKRTSFNCNRMRSLFLL